MLRAARGQRSWRRRLLVAGIAGTFGFIAAVAANLFRDLGRAPDKIDWAGLKYYVEPTEPLHPRLWLEHLRRLDASGRHSPDFSPRLDVDVAHISICVCNAEEEEEPAVRFGTGDSPTSPSDRYYFAMYFGFTEFFDSWTFRLHMLIFTVLGWFGVRAAERTLDGGWVQVDPRPWIRRHPYENTGPASRLLWLAGMVLPHQHITSVMRPIVADAREDIFAALAAGKTWCARMILIKLVPWMILNALETGIKSLLQRATRYGR